MWLQKKTRLTCVPEELSGSSLWLHGPTWLLSEDKAYWPKMDVGNRPTTLPETKKLNHKQETEGDANVLTCCSQRPALQEKRSEKELECEGWRLEPTRFLSWTRLVRLQARVWQALYNMRSPDSRSIGQELLPEDITDAEEEIIRKVQQEAFPEEYMELTVGKEFPKKSLLNKLCP